MCMRSTELHAPASFILARRVLGSAERARFRMTAQPQALFAGNLTDNWLSGVCVLCSTWQAAAACSALIRLAAPVLYREHPSALRTRMTTVPWWPLLPGVAWFHDWPGGVVFNRNVELIGQRSATFSGFGVFSRCLERRPVCRRRLEGGSRGCVNFEVVDAHPVQSSFKQLLHRLQLL